MAVTHSGAALAAATDAVVDLIDGGVGAGKLVFRATPSSVASPGTAAATLTMSDPAFGNANGTTGIATASAITSDTNAAGGTVAFATLQTSADTIVIHFAVAASGSDCDFSNGLGVTAGDTVTCSAMTYRAIAA